MYGNRIKNLRKERNLTQTELAKKLNTTQKMISKYECETIEMNFDTLMNYANYFNCSIDYLLGREDEFGIIQSKNELTQVENQLLTLFKTLNERDQNKVLGYVQALAY